MTTYKHVIEVTFESNSKFPVSLTDGAVFGALYRSAAQPNVRYVTEPKVIVPDPTHGQVWCDIGKPDVEFTIRLVGQGLVVFERGSQVFDMHVATVETFSKYYEFVR